MYQKARPSIWRPKELWKSMSDLHPSIHIHIHIHIHIRPSKQTYIHVCACARVRACVRGCVCVFQIYLGLNKTISRTCRLQRRLQLFALMTASTSGKASWAKTWRIISLNCRRQRFASIVGVSRPLSTVSRELVGRDLHFSLESGGRGRVPKPLGGQTAPLQVHPWICSHRLQPPN